jgi:hypothetical protein
MLVAGYSIPATAAPPAMFSRTNATFSRGQQGGRNDSGLQGYTGVHGSTQGYTGAHRSTQGYTGVHRGTQGYTGVHRGTQGYTGVHSGTQGFILEVMEEVRGKGPGLG